MSNLRVKQHPTLGILVGTDGHVMIPANGKRKAHWTLGCTSHRRYPTVRIGGKDFSVHRLVVETFIGPIHKGLEVDHLNRNPADNRLENLRICTHSDNCRNRSDNDRVDARGGTHLYEDQKQYIREHNARYYAENKDKFREYNAHYYANHPEKSREYMARYRGKKKKTHRVVPFADGSHHWVPNADAILLLAIPLKERHYHAK